MTQSAIGGPAQTTYRVTSRQGVSGRDAQRVFVVSDGRPQEGGPQQAVYYVSDAEIAAGDFVISGNKPIPIVEVGQAGAEYPPIAVYVVKVNSESDFPPVPEPPPAGDPIGDALRAAAVAYWKFDEASGNRADATSRGNTAVQSGTVQSAAGKVGNCAVFEYAGSQYLDAGNAADVQIGTGSFTIAGWFKFTAATLSQRSFIAKHELDGSSVEYRLSYSVSSSEFSFSCAGDSVFGDEVFEPSADTWYFIVAQYDAVAGEPSIKINNTAFTSYGPFGPAIASTGNCIIGGDVLITGNLMIDGSIDEVGFWKRLLTSDEIVYLYNSGAGRALFP